MAVFIFLFYVAAGLLVSLGIVKIGAEGRRFFLFNAALAFALASIGLVLRIALPIQWGWAPELQPGLRTAVLGVVGLVLLAAYLVVGAMRREQRTLVRVSALFLALAVLSDALALHSPGSATSSTKYLWLHVLNAGTSAWLAGSILLSMVLGHFYLVLPRLSIAPLRGLFTFSLVGLAARIVVVAVAGALWLMADGASTLSVAMFLNTGVFVLQRVLFGLLIPTSLAWFTWKTIEMRSTQSATGILYVVVFLTLVGEALSVYLSLGTGIPL